MNRCIFLDARGGRCARTAQAGDLYCRVHLLPLPRAEEEAASGASGRDPHVEEDEPVELPPWQRLARRPAAALLLAFFLFQTYLMMRELLKGN